MLTPSAVAEGNKYLTHKRDPAKRLFSKRKEKSENLMVFALNLSHPGLEPGTT